MNYLDFLRRDFLNKEENQVEHQIDEAGSLSDNDACEFIEDDSYSKYLIKMSTEDINWKPSIFNNSSTTNNDCVRANYNYDNVRFTESEIEAMSVKERHEICSQCANHHNLEALIDFYKYFCYHGGAVTNEYYIPALTFLYGRKHDTTSLDKMLNEFSFFIMNLSEDSKQVTKRLWEIGIQYPNLSFEQINYLEYLYNTSKYCEVMDDILYDKEKLQRHIYGITKEDLKKTNTQFSIDLLIMTFNGFIYNQQAQNQRDDEYTKYYVYVKRNNNVIKKPYGQVGAGEVVLSGTLDVKMFIEYIELKYGEKTSAFFLKRILEKKPWYKNASFLLCNYYNWIDWYELIDIAKDFWGNDSKSFDGFKLDVAYIYLVRLSNPVK